VTAQSPVPADSVRAVLDAVLAQPAYAWHERRHPLAFLWEAMGALRDWLDQLAADHPVAFLILMLALTSVLVVILTHFGYLIWRSLRSRPEEPGRRPPQAGPVRDEAWHLAAYRRLLAEGRYTEAMGERFAVLVLELGRGAAVRPDHSKTPAEYAAEARLDAAGRSALSRLVEELYLRLFGGEPCTADDVRRFDVAAGALRGHVAPS
jgi:Domain of unknown function (DUF4129)